MNYKQNKIPAENFRLLLFISILLTGLACKTNKSDKSEEDNPVLKDSSTITKTSTIEGEIDQPSPKEKRGNQDSIPSHVLKRGETLWDISKEQYGNRHYADLLSIYNEIDDVHHLEPGTKIKVPDMLRLLISEKVGLAPLHPEVEAILKARAIFMRHEKELYEYRSDSSSTLSPVIQADLEKARKSIDMAVKSLQNRKNPPQKMAGQLKSVSSTLRDLSQGKHDGPYGYDLDMVHQRIVHAFKNGIAWVKAE